MSLLLSGYEARLLAKSVHKRPMALGEWTDKIARELGLPIGVKTFTVVLVGSSGECGVGCGGKETDDLWKLLGARKPDTGAVASPMPSADRCLTKDRWSKDRPLPTGRALSFGSSPSACSSRHGGRLVGTAELSQKV
jgi:hypothetical protein